MGIRIVAAAAGVLLAAGSAPHFLADPVSLEAVARVSIALPSETEARELLDNTLRHREWVNLGTGRSALLAFVAYPERADNAPVVVMAAKQESVSTRLRAMALKIADAGYIAVVPEPGIVVGKIEAARRYGTSLPAANGQSATLVFDLDQGRVDATVEQPHAGQRSGRFDLTTQGWPQAVAFLTAQTRNHPVVGSNPHAPIDHAQHLAMAQGTATGARAEPPPADPFKKMPDLPADYFNAHTTILDSKMRRQFVDIPLGAIKLHTWVEYPQGEGKAPIAIVMQSGLGMNDWAKGIADQLAIEGFIAISPDLHSGLGPNGGGFESFRGTDEVMRGLAKINQDEMMRRYKSALEWGKKLPRWNGKVVSIGFCLGGGNSFRFAGEVPELAAAVTYYGANPSEQLMAKITAPVLAFYAEDDARVTAAAAPASAAMKRLGKSFEYHIYPRATHGFMEFPILSRNQEATRDSWMRTVAFLKKNAM